MKRSKLICMLLVFSLLIPFITGCVTLGEDSTTATDTEESETKEETENPLHRYELETYHYLTDVEESFLLTGLDRDYLLLVNKENSLSSSYVPSPLSRLTCNTTYPMELERQAAYALYEMLREMEAAGFDIDDDDDDGENGYDIAVTSAYRPYKLQTELFYGYIEQELNHPDGFSPEAYACLGEEYIQTNYIEQGVMRLSSEDARRVVLSYSAEPGKSEHQTGLCVDFITEDMNDQLTTVFEEKAVFAWLSVNAYKFGFILRYPKDKEDITGYMYEPWHYRFVGREAATDIYFADLTLEEYLELLYD